jgi:uncharacterized membrane protein YfcA
VDVTVIVIGLGVGVAYGGFGAGGSAFATPLLALAGVPGMAAVASPLPATVPAAVAGAWSYVRAGHVDRRTARDAMVGGVPGTVAGALVAPLVGGAALLSLSALLLAGLGARLLAPARGATAAGSLPGRRLDRTGVVVAGAVVGVLTGLLANGGGFLLVPLFVLAVGLGMRRAAGTSLVTGAVLSVPTLLTHWALGDIDWAISFAFAMGLVPGALVGARLVHRLDGAVVQRTFGALLVVFAVGFLASHA